MPICAFAPTIMLATLISQWPSPSLSQATCSFISTEFPQFSIQELPIEPSHPNGLQICRPSGQTCCTQKLEAEFIRMAQSQLEADIQSQIRLIQSSFSQNAQKFTVHFKTAINQTSNILRLLFQRTYGHFFVQNQMIFDEFFADLHKMFDPPNLCTANFSNSLEMFFSRIFVAEFSLLNPLRPISQDAEKCMLEFLPQLWPFGPIPGTISTLLNRTFRLWASLNCALQNANEQLEKLAKLFSLPQNCSHSLAQMRFCHLCSSEALLHRPCPLYCQNVFRDCLNGFNEFEPQWNRLITLFLQLLPQLHSVHNPHSALHPLPIQISEAIMHFQEKGQLLSSRILFRCFGEDFQKIMGERRKRRNIEEEEIGNWTENDYGEEGEGEGIEFHLLDIEAIQNTKRWADQFKDELLRQNGFWNSLPRMFCREGGIQSRPGEFCWNGTKIGRWKGNGAENKIIRNNREYSEKEEKYAQLRHSIQEIAEELAAENGLIYEQNGIPMDDEDSEEGSGDLEENEGFEYYGAEELPVNYQRQWSRKELGNRPNGGSRNNGQKNEGKISKLFWKLFWWIFIIYFVQIRIFI